MDTRVQPITDHRCRLPVRLTERVAQSEWHEISRRRNDVKSLTAKWIMAVHPVGIEPPMRRRKLSRLIPNPLNIFAKYFLTAAVV